jgi:uncharacterized caspase-like protein
MTSFYGGSSTTPATLGCWPLVVLAGLLWLALAGPPAAASGARVALVIGNGAYSSVGRLANPGNDARLVAGNLKASGFTLVGGDAQIDLDKPHFDGAVAAFGRAIKGADVALFYYSGHGLQVDGTNFLVPVDANPTSRQDLDFQMVSADLMLRQMSGGGARLNILILDACRNNPFEGTGLRSTTGGLAEMKAPRGTLISYATQPGAVARDGAGRDSPFTLALVDAMRRPGLDLFWLFNKVGLDVETNTGGQQQPWLSASPIEGQFSFTGTPGVAPAPAPTSAPAVAPIAAAPAPAPARAPVATAAETAASDAKTTSGMAAVSRPAVAGGLLPAAVPALRQSGSRRCPDKDWMIFGGDETFDWNGDKVTVRSVNSTWAWRSLGTDPASPNTCLRTGVTGVAHRLVGWFNTDKFEFPESPERPTLALLQGQTTDATVRYFARQHTGSGARTVFTTQWHLRGRERFRLNGVVYDTLAFDLSESNNRNANIAHGRVWYAPALGLFVRKIWRRANSDKVLGFSLFGVAANGIGRSQFTVESGQ